jgi:RNA polymerase sigma-70 factor, ECF subfamily
MSEHVKALVERAKAGDRIAASQLITEFYERVFAYLRRRCGSEEDAADLTQRTFCKAWNSVTSYNHRSTFNTWLHAIAHHVYLDWRRVAQRCDSLSDEWWEACPGNEPGPFENAAEREAGQQVYRAVEQLEEAQRDVIHLHYYQSLSIQETAEALGIATSTVKYRLRNALSALESRLAEPKLHSLKENS